MNKFVILATSYNNSAYTEQHLQSLLTQQYTGNWRIIWVNDCSTDDTWAKSANFVNGTAKNHKITMINNSQRVGALENIYNSIHNLTQDDEIILSVDGDDWLVGSDVLQKLDNYYDNNTWLTYGQYRNTASNALGHCRQYSDAIIRQNQFRQSTWNASHLRTYYSWLFKRIKKEDLIDTNGRFYQMTWDFAKMFPMLEMAGDHSKFISEILYIYNDNNPICDHKVSRNEQARLDAIIRNKSRYQPLIANQIPQLQHLQNQPENNTILPTHNMVLYIQEADFNLIPNSEGKNELVFGSTTIRKGK